MTTTRKIEDRYLTEYSTTHDAYLHYDTFSWQVGTVLVAAVFVFLGFLLQPDVTDPRLFAAGSILVSILMSAWILCEPEACRCADGNAFRRLRWIYA